MDTSKRVKDLIANMSLKEKAAQMTQFGLYLLYSATNADNTGDAMRFNLGENGKYLVGSILNFNTNEREVVVNEVAKNFEGDIPLCFMMDIVHGCKTIFPIPLAMGCTFDTDLLEDCAEMSAKEAKAAGVDLTFSPMVDLARDARWGRVMETTGEDHYLNGEMGKAFIRGYHKGGIAACVKHFAAYGAAEAGRDYNTTDLSDFQLQEYYLHAYRECLKEKPEMFMSSFNCLNGKPVNAHHELLVDLLRDKWGFDGVLISDYNAIDEMRYHGHLETLKECAEVALKNEIDIEMMSPGYLSYLPELVEEGKISEEHVDKMLARVLTLKEQLGLFENPLNQFNPELFNKLCLCEEHRDLVRRAAEKSFVLLKNEDVLPLKKSQKVALVGPFADERDIIGFWRAYGKIEDTPTIRERLQEYLGKEVPCARGCSYDLYATDESGFSEAESAAKSADVVLACIGEFGKFSGEGNSRAKADVPAVQVSLVKKMKESGKKVVGVVFGGRPLILTEVEPYLDAILYVWQPGTEGGMAIVNTLYGKNVPAGKTTMTFPRSVGQCPIHYNELHTGRRKENDTRGYPNYLSAYLDEYNRPLYPFGYGLSYTTFEMSPVKLSKNEMTADEKITASVTVKNVGNYDGEEVVQLYIRDKFAKFVRPVKELKDYKKIFLKKGEEQTVTFTVDIETLSYYDDKGNRTYENGSFDIMVGNASDNVTGELLILK